MADTKDIKAPKSERIPPRAEMQPELPNRKANADISDDAITRWLGPVVDHGSGFDVPLQWSNTDIGMDFQMSDHLTSTTQPLGLYPLMSDAPQMMEQMHPNERSSLEQTPQTDDLATTKLSTQSCLEKLDDCEQRASATLQTLEFSAGSQLKSRLDEYPETFIEASTISSSLCSGTSTSIGTTLDKVLHSNKAALGNLSRLLDCSCAQQPHLALLYASIVSKILLRYRIAAHVQSPSLPGVLSKPLTSSFAQSSPISSKVGQPLRPGGVFPTSIQIGVFNMDEEDQLTLQRGLLLRETRKVEKVIDKMASLDGGHNIDDDCSESTVASWYALSSNKLRIELHETLKEVKDFATARTGSDL
ncbi:MAG: hypothetical protein Q9160_006500 [Pyrenula sp. 1 TL-2023]